MFPLRIVGVLICSLATGCASVADPSPVAAAPVPSVAIQPPSTVEPAEAAPTPDVVLPDVPAIVEPETDQVQATAKSVAPSAKPAARQSSTPELTEPPRKAPDHPAAATPSEPPLDIAALKARLRDTSAFGVFTKLALKNQVDDLLARFRAHYGSGQASKIASLREPYDTLVFKVVGLLKDADPLLARAVAGSRESIWRILADPVQFKLAT